MQWKVNSRETIYDLKNNDLGISIHRIHGLNGWYLSSRTLGISQKNLDTEDFNEAVKKSQIMIMEYVSKLHESACDFVKNVYDNNEFMKW